MDIVLSIPEDTVDELTDLVCARLCVKPEPRFLSKKALAEFLGVTERRIKTLRERGLPARKLGRDLSST
jgi:hypothetical protein